MSRVLKLAAFALATRLLLEAVGRAIRAADEATEATARALTAARQATESADGADRSRADLEGAANVVEQCRDELVVEIERLNGNQREFVAEVEVAIARGAGMVLDASQGAIR